MAAFQDYGGTGMNGRAPVSAESQRRMCFEVAVNAKMEQVKRVQNSLNLRLAAVENTLSGLTRLLEAQQRDLVLAVQSEMTGIRAYLEETSREQFAVLNSQLGVCGPDGASALRDDDGPLGRSRAQDHNAVAATNTPALPGPEDEDQEDQLATCQEAFFDRISSETHTSRTRGVDCRLRIEPAATSSCADPPIASQLVATKKRQNPSVSAGGGGGGGAETEALKRGLQNTSARQALAIRNIISQPTRDTANCNGVGINSVAAALERGGASTTVLPPTPPLCSECPIQASESGIQTASTQRRKRKRNANTENVTIDTARPQANIISFLKRPSVTNDTYSDISDDSADTAANTKPPPSRTRAKTRSIQETSINNRTPTRSNAKISRSAIENVHVGNVVCAPETRTRPRVSASSISTIDQSSDDEDGRNQESVARSRSQSEIATAATPSSQCAAYLASSARNSDDESDDENDASENILHDDDDDDDDDDDAADATVLPEQYAMRRDLKTVGDAWKEYTIGLDGGPAIRKLDYAHQFRWRSTKRERTFYSRRMVIIRYLLRRIKLLGRTADQVVGELELFRQKNKYTLNFLSRRIRKFEKQGEGKLLQGVQALNQGSL